MTRTSRISFIAITFASAGFAMLGQGASASTAYNTCSELSAAQMSKCCARLANQDMTACREAFTPVKKKRQVTVRLMKVDDGGGNGSGGKGGKGGRGGQK